MTTRDGPSYHFAYYCSGHGFGHATRVAAITAGLLSRGHRVSIVSSAPEKVFDSVLGRPPPTAQASYRFAVFEPVVDQPKAYVVDRTTTFNNLHAFLTLQRLAVIEHERQWLLDQHVHCVLIDAPFLPCAAASQAKIPSVIVSNFTFDSCYSYLAAFGEDEDGGPRIDAERLDALVAITVADYSKAELLLRLPGEIPIPGFDDDITLPATTWTDERTGYFRADIDTKLQWPMRNERATRAKKVIDMPLVVRPLSGAACDPQTKLTLLQDLGVPAELLNMETRILLVSFGGQVIPSPRPPTSTDCGLDELPETSETTHPAHSLLPPGWIAIICGLPPSSRPHELPHNFFSIANSKFNYVPDLTAVADVVMGKLGYGTCSEVISTRTPFISVPRKMFVEEYGLKRLMNKTGTVNVEMSIREFEEGRWCLYITLAHRLGQQQQQPQPQDFSAQSGPAHLLKNGIDKSRRAVESVVDHLEVFLSRHKNVLQSP
ncbi:hypothetical protein PCANC_05269 [Puccinia coronata f. sp. avenae]|uniref:L-arabinokinase n=1 Tax=Puccinia coronata f. sp. avenae TaxID=200324 RepID=A0A2N5VYP6_9BASI|nr:hypothetical protein PCANC_05269 [Puccinia coronata f. sp. avenae]